MTTTTVPADIRVGDNIVYITHDGQRSSAVVAGVDSPDTLLVSITEDDFEEIPRTSVVDVARDDEIDEHELALAGERLTAAQFDGLACISCGCSFADTGVPSVPIAFPGRGQVFGCVTHDALPLAGAVVRGYVAELAGAEHMCGGAVVRLSLEYEKDPDPARLRSDAAAAVRKGVESYAEHLEVQREYADVKLPEGGEAAEDWDTYGGCDLIRTVAWSPVEVCEDVTVRVEAEQHTDGSLTNVVVSLSTRENMDLTPVDAVALATAVAEASTFARTLVTA